MKSTNSKVRNSIEFYQSRKQKDSLVITKTIALQLLPLCGPYYGSILEPLVRTDNFEALIKINLDYRMFDMSQESQSLQAAAVRQLLALYTKDISLPTSIDKEAVALETFCETEIICRQVNDKLYNLYEAASAGGPIYDRSLGDYRPQVWKQSEFNKLEPDLRKIIFLAQERIASILGEVPSLSELTFEFGPGSSTTVKQRTTARHKLDAVPVCSKDSLGSIESLYETLPLYAHAHARRIRVGSGILSFVPKSAKTFRSMIIEPTLNTAVQKGIGSHIVKRMKLCGLDLKNGWETNKRLARQGSLGSRISTVDGSSASDLIAYSVVDLLLQASPGWFELLCNWRTSVVACKTFGNKLLTLAKFSTMGNGFTFELESLIFYSIACACCNVMGITDDQIVTGEKPVAIYGDDLIIPSEVFPLYKATAEWFGFKINNEKSYISGPFRESCGGDYLNGTSIRPFYVKDRWTSARLVGFLNHCSNAQVNVLSTAAYKYILSLIPVRDRNFGPSGYGDGHIVDANYRWLPLKQVRQTCTNKAFVGPPRMETVDNQHDLHFFYTLKKVTKKDTTPCYFGDFMIFDYQISVWNPNPDFKHQRGDIYIIGAAEKVTRSRVAMCGRVGETKRYAQSGISVFERNIWFHISRSRKFRSLGISSCAS